MRRDGSRKIHCLNIREGPITDLKWARRHARAEIPLAMRCLAQSSNSDFFGVQKINLRLRLDPLAGRPFPRAQIYCD